MNIQKNRTQAIELIENNRISTTEIGDVLGKTGQVEGVYPLNRQQFRAGEVVCIYAINNSNYEVHKQVAELDLADKILFIYNVNCDKAIFGDLVSKYILLYKRAKAIVINGILRDIPDLIKENYPIWLNGKSPIGCVNRKNGPDIDPELYKEIKEKYDGSIMVCDDSGVVMIPKEKINDKCPPDCYYAFSKLSDAVWGNGYSGLVDFHYLQNSVERIAGLSACNSSQEVYVVLKAGFFAKNSDLCKQT